MSDPTILVRQMTRARKGALRLLARGGARYGTRYAQMRELKELGWCYAHDNGRPPPGRWTWRPTETGWKVIRALEEYDAELAKARTDRRAVEASK